MLKKRITLPVVIGSVAIILVAVCLSSLAYASVNNVETNSNHSTAKGFEVQDKVTGLADENANVITNKGAVWRSSDLVTPFVQKVYPTRNSTPDLSVPREDWGVGQLAPVAPGNHYVPGQCTWYVYNRRMQLGRPIGGYWGNGGSWHYPAAAQWFIVDHSPEVGAVFEESGHVAVVEEIGLDNSVHISEMNYNYVPYRYNERWVKNANQYWYIH